jgi:hypothetical protein
MHESRDEVAGAWIVAVLLIAAIAATTLLPPAMMGLDSRAYDVTVRRVPVDLPERGSILGELDLPLFEPGAGVIEQAEVPLPDSPPAAHDGAAAAPLPATQPRKKYCTTVWPNPVVG